MCVVVEVSGTVVVEAGGGMVVMESPPVSLEGIGLSSIDHRIRGTGEYVETIIVSGPSSDSPAYTHVLIVDQIMDIVHVVPTASTLMGTTRLCLHS